MNEIRKRIVLAASVDRVWTFLTDPARIAEWLMDSDLVEVAEGASFQFVAEPAGAWDGKIYCTIQDVIEKERISYTWEANDIQQRTLVTFDLEPVAGGTALSLTHTNFEGAQPGSAGRHAAGWTNCLKALRTAVEGKTDAYDWSVFTITRFVDAPVPAVFALWSTVDGIRRFWADAATCHDPAGNRRADEAAFKTGDRIDLRFPTETETWLEILNIETNRFILFSFGEDYGWVRVRFTAAGARTRMELAHFGLPEGAGDDWNVHVNAYGWWVSNLDNIASVLASGHDLRVREPGVTNGLGARFSPGGDLPAAHDWTAFDIYLYYNAAPDTVLEYWRTAAGLERFFIQAAQIQSRSGERRAASDPIAEQDTYVWQFIHPFEVRGEFTRVTGSSVSFSFGSKFHVDVSVEPCGAGTLLHLHQSGMEDTPQERVHGSLNCRSCWIHYLVNLKSVVECGADLRDGEPETTDSFSVGYNSR